MNNNLAHASRDPYSQAARVHVIDLHTGGEPTRIVLGGCPDLGKGTVAEQLQVLRSQHDHFRVAVVCKPRGSNIMVAAVLCEPSDASCVCGVIFMNNVGYLSMCGHGMIALGKLLQYQGRVNAGGFRVETPVGTVDVTLDKDGAVSVRNVPAYRKAKDATIHVPGIGIVRGDVAWGGNWFFLIHEHEYRLELSDTKHLMAVTWKIRQAVNEQGFPEVDHIELFGTPRDSANDSRNFVLCPGGEYDRSPCGTGTSAKIACLAADGKLAPGVIWRQESIVGSVFEGSYESTSEGVIPTIKGKAYIVAEGHLILHPDDPTVRRR